MKSLAIIGLVLVLGACTSVPDKRNACLDNAFNKQIDMEWYMNSGLYGTCRRNEREYYRTHPTTSKSKQSVAMLQETK